VGSLRQKIAFMNKAGKKIGVIHQLQHESKTVEVAKTGQEVACSVQNITIGRQIKEDDVFYTLPPPDDAKQYLKKFKHKLNSDEIKVLNEIVEIIRVTNPIYGY
jgi:translation initiation factor 5B